MKLVNRGFLVVYPTRLFTAWSDAFDDFLIDNPLEHREPNVYLITEDFLEAEPVIEQNFKRIFKNELAMVTENEADWPEDLSFDKFLLWFSIVPGSTVFDLEKPDLRSEKI